MNSENQQYIVNYLNAGGALYIESPDIGMNHSGTEMFSMFGAEYLFDGGQYEVNTLSGQSGTITENLTFTYNGGEDSHYSLDHLSPIFGEVLFQSEDQIDRVISNDLRGYRTIISSILLGCFFNGTGNNTKAYLMEQYLSYLDVDYISEGEVCGTIIDEFTQQPIEGIHVTIGEIDAYTDPNGFFWIILDEGIYSMTFQHDDYEFAIVENVVVIPIETTTVDLQMTPLVEAGNNLVAVTELKGNYPNPFNPSTTISFSIAEHAKNAKLIIYNLKGQKVKTFLINSSTDQQINSVVWNGTDDTGKSVSSGIYFYKMKAGTYISTKKMILMK